MEAETQSMKPLQKKRKKEGKKEGTIELMDTLPLSLKKKQWIHGKYQHQGKETPELGPEKIVKKE
jgi:hypothetical protein